MKFDPNLTWEKFVVMSDERRAQYMDLLIAYWRAKDEQDVARLHTLDREEELKYGWVK
jgi:hypothetical protein